ncbi:DUF420 domain-containing protein [Schleiferia thermophila]|jgi:putative membrane protein|uniref:DUF420 domain-containing protein n=2 Tax=Schleiferia thermophila TaxID=884107 RepID=UPI0004E70659|nr:DUF420 domain-containing protein [Schleiferia thermophila]KFD39643.1 membrane protein [Schleiferia thermophila str. Yellowstone]PMB29355.1 DUF420 domain-containing protein [Fischerella thermalis CCMEE 5319]
MGVGIKKNDSVMIPVIVTLSVLVPVAVAVLMIYPETFSLENSFPQAKKLPAFHAFLNGTTAVLLILGGIFISRKKIHLHRAVMVAAFVLSALFLVSYVVSKVSNPPTPFGGEGATRIIYFFILITHIALSVPVLPLAMLSIYRGSTMEINKHKKLVKYTYPIWLYVAITGVLVYVFMSPYYPV